jgi:type I restriction enzyme M protein
VVVPHGVLFRGGQEGAIRRALIEENMLDGVVGLPSNLFYGAGIPAALVVFDKGRKPRGKDPVFFIDASREFEQGTNQNRLRDEDVAKITDTFHGRTEVEKYSHLAGFEEIEENDFNLNIPRYVDTFEPEPEIDMDEVQADIERINRELAELEAKMDGYLRELGFKS